jgi:hypothetical protein
MNTSPTPVLVTLLAFTVSAGAQVSFPNKTSSAEAANIAGQLSLGMAEREIDRFLATNGLKWGYTKEVRPVKVYPKDISLEEIEKRIATIETNVAPEAFCFYALQDHCLLRLHVSLEPGISTNRVLRSASIESNGVPIASIALKKRP